VVSRLRTGQSSLVPAARRWRPRRPLDRGDSGSAASSEAIPARPRRASPAAHRPALTCGVGSAPARGPGIYPGGGATLCVLHPGGAGQQPAYLRRGALIPHRPPPASSETPVAAFGMLWLTSQQYDQPSSRRVPPGTDNRGEASSLVSAFQRGFLAQPPAYTDPGDRHLAWSSTKELEPDKPPLQCRGDRLRAIGHPKLLKDDASVEFYRPLGDAELIGDLLVARALN
jgi:hypothetical protein